jgi:hypothetical protein
LKHRSHACSPGWVRDAGQVDQLFSFVRPRDRNEELNGLVDAIRTRHCNCHRRSASLGVIETAAESVIGPTAIWSDRKSGVIEERLALYS